MRAAAVTAAPANGTPRPRTAAPHHAGVQDPDEACYLYEYHSPLNVGTRMSSGPGAMLGVIVASAVGALALWRATFDASFE